MTTPTIPLDQFKLNVTGMVLCWSSFKVVQRHTLCVELWLPRHHTKLEKCPDFLNILLLQNPLVRFQDHLIEMFLE